MQKRPQAPKPIFLDLGSEKSENWIPIFGNFGKYLKFAHGNSVHNGSSKIDLGENSETP